VPREARSTTTRWSSSSSTNRPSGCNHGPAESLVERVRDPHDRRSVRVRLTTHGRAVVDDLIGKHLANEARLLQELPRARADKLAELMRELLETLGDTSLS
jgi:DNA-binding MarR family transcriptional regulator